MLLLCCLWAATVAGGAEFLYVAPDGDDGNPGTLAEPFATLGRAQQEVEPGTTVYFRGGTHAVEVSEVAQYSGIFARVFDLGKSGTEAEPIRYWAYPGEEPVFDLSAVNPAGYRIYTFHITGDWLHFRGLTVTGVPVNITTHTQSICFENSGSHNVFERLVMRDNQAIGMMIGGGSHNLVLNCDAYRNWDFTSDGGVGGNVDGFGCHYGIGPGNVFRGCRAWFNSDDGYDCISAASPVTFEGCWAFYNGFNSSFQSLGNGNGFKAGGYGGTGAASLPDPVPRHVVRGCLAVRNKQSGFYSNHHPGGVDFVGNTAWRNKRNFNLLCRTADNLTDVDGYGHFLRNDLGHAATLVELANADLAACDSSHNFFDLSVNVTATDFESLDESLLTTPRQASGALPAIPLMRLKEGSDLIDAGTAVGAPFTGGAPDLGCFERDVIEVGNAGFSLPARSQRATRPAGMVWDFSGAAGASPEGGWVGVGGSIRQVCDGFVPGERYHMRVAVVPVGGSSEVRLGGTPRSVVAAGWIDAAWLAEGSSEEISIEGIAGETGVSGVEVRRVTAGSDVDGDSLADGWEFDAFGDLREGPQGDFDGDGSINAVEAALGLDPASSSESFRCRLAANELRWPGVSGVTFGVERSGDLLGWEPIGEVAGEAPETGFTDPEPPAGGAFYRVRLEL